MALLTNRYVAEQECLRVGAQHIVCAGNPPNIDAVCSTYPCLRSVIQQLGYLPPQSAAETTSKNIRKLLVSRLPEAKITLALPAVKWKSTWKNVGSSKLSSQQRSTLYLLANGKLSHGELLYRMKRADTPLCAFCVNVDTLEHKFALCEKVKMAWDLLKNTIASYVPDCQLSFSNLRFCNLSVNNVEKQTTVMRIFANYIIHIVGNNDAAIDLNVLQCYLIS